MAGIKRSMSVTLNEEQWERVKASGLSLSAFISDLMDQDREIAGLELLEEKPKPIVEDMEYYANLTEEDMQAIYAEGEAERKAARWAKIMGLGLPVHTHRKEKTNDHKPTHFQNGLPIPDRPTGNRFIIKD
jgi:uncharacterized protein (DUF58 family)